MYTRDDIIRSAAEKWLGTTGNLTPNSTIADIRSGIYNETYYSIEAYNAVAGKGGKYRQVNGLTNWQIAYAIAVSQHVRLIQCAGASGSEELSLLAVYQDDGPKKGLYDGNGPALRRLIREFNSEVSKRDIDEVEAILRDMVPQLPRTIDPDLVPVNNGIFNYKTKQLLPFSPDYVFLAKVGADYNPAAANKVMTNPDGTTWDIESWMQGLFDDQAVTSLIWHLIGACVRPYVRWDKTAWFYSTSGNSGKGTLLTLLKALIGEGNYASIKLAEMDKDFALEELVRASCILTDENNVGEYIDKSANMKAIATGDTIQITRKFKMPVTFRFYGMSIQCLNEIPRVRDRSGSLARRCLIVKFDRCYTGMERRYIKDQYLVDKDVLEYVLYKVLCMMPDYYALPDPASCKMMLEQFTLANSPVLEFMDDMLPELSWDVVPFNFIYALYRGWMQRNAPSGGILGRNQFISELMDNAASHPCRWAWKFPDRDTDGKWAKVSVGNGMAKPERLIAEYNLTEWYNKLYRGNDIDQLCTPAHAPDRCRGIVRMTATNGQMAS